MSPRTQRRWWSAVVVGLMAFAAVLVLLNAPSNEDEESPSATTRSSQQEPRSEVERRCGRYAELARDRGEVVTGSGPRVVVIGDSWAVGRNVGPHQTWPAYLPGEVHVHGFPGSAISRTDIPRCGGVSFAERAPQALAEGADLVVVEGGLNDVLRTDRQIRTGFRKLLRELEGHPTVVLAPPPTPKRGDTVRRVDALLTEMSAKAGVAYVQTADIDLSFLDDGLHPDAAGHRAFGTAVAKRIRALGMVDFDAPR